MRRAGAVQKADRLAGWLETLLHLHAAQVLPLDISAACLLGCIADQARADGRAPGWANLAIAATAQFNGLTVLTRNVRLFRMTRTNVHDPFVSLPADL